MDDGFQNRKIVHDLNIVMIDAIWKDLALIFHFERHGSHLSPSKRAANVLLII